VDPVEDVERYNRLLEAQVRLVPEQYLWVHRRFKGLSSDYPDTMDATLETPSRNARRITPPRLSPWQTSLTVHSVTGVDLTLSIAVLGPAAMPS